MANPYSYKPIEDDRWFFDQDRVVEEIKQQLDTGQSCVVVGGDRMGKTSILKHVKRMFSSVDQPTTSRFIPIYFEPHTEESVSIKSVYRQLITDTISQTRHWLMNCKGDVPEVRRVLEAFISPLMITESVQLDGNEACGDFEKDLNVIISTVLYAVGNTRLLFLLDHIYCIEDKSVQKAFIQHWLQLLDTKFGFLAVIVASVRDFLDQFDLRRPEVSMGLVSGHQIVVPTYLCVFEQKHSSQVVQIPFKETLGVELSDKVASEVYNLTGGHPYLLQSAMSDLWADTRAGKLIDIGYVQSCIPAWIDRHSVICDWIDGMISAHEELGMGDVLQWLLNGKVWKITELGKALEGLPISLGKLRRALRILGYLGLVCEVRKQAYQISGELFREYFRLVSETRLDERHYRAWIKRLDEEISGKIRQLRQHRDKDGIVEIRTRLKEKLIDLRTDWILLIQIEESLGPESPAFRELIRDIQSIRYEVRFEVYVELSELGIHSSVRM
jgi:hypothetical protein